MLRSFVLAVPFLIIGTCDKMSFANEPGKSNESNTGSISSRDWPWWRGPQRNGVASANQQPPLHWSETENVIWKTPVSGRGHSSPTVVGQKIFLLTSEPDDKVQSVLCFHRESGEQLWKTPIHQGEFLVPGTKTNSKSTFANSTVACDGERIFANFLHEGVVYTSALDLNGKQIWQEKITDYILHQGFGSSPSIHKNLVIVSADNKGGGVIVAMEKATGKRVWKVDRPKIPNYTSPIILTVAGREQIILYGCSLVTSLDPSTGEKNWEIEGATQECVTSTVTDGKLIFTSGGYPRNHLTAIHADGSGKIAWENGSRVYVPSMLMNDGYLYVMLDAGVATCYKSDTGEEIWKERLGGTLSSSPVLVGDNIFITNETGKTFIFKATPKGYDKVAENQLGQEVFATPTICGDRIYMRAATTIDGKRQESLYCLGVKQ